DAGIGYESAVAEFVPNLKVEIDADTARKVFRLIDALEDSDDVQNGFSNFDLAPEVQAALVNDGQGHAGRPGPPCCTDHRHRPCASALEATRSVAGRVRRGRPRPRPV